MPLTRLLKMPLFSAKTGKKASTPKNAKNSSNIRDFLLFFTILRHFSANYAKTTEFDLKQRNRNF
jgi:hypothetical protein